MSFKPKGYKFHPETAVTAELDKCFHCERKPCQQGCPCNCSPMEFLNMLRTGEKCDISRATAAIYSQNPFGGVCGVVCPEIFCQKMCSRKKLDVPINIPCVQAWVVRKARQLKVMPPKNVADPKPQKFAVIGTGPAGIAASAYLAMSGYTVDLFEKDSKMGGACNLIPPHRLPRDMLDADLNHWTSMDNIHVHMNTEADYNELASKYDAVGVAKGVGGCRMAECENSEKALTYTEFLSEPAKFAGKFKGKKVVVVGGGPVSVDCATTARMSGADEVILMYRRGQNEMPITTNEREWLLEASVNIVPRTIPKKIHIDVNGNVTGLQTVRVAMPNRSTGSKESKEVEGSVAEWPDVSVVIMAAGQTLIGEKTSDLPNVFFGGDCRHGASTVVQASAGGKEMASMMEAFAVPEKTFTPNKKAKKSCVAIPGVLRVPRDLSVDFFGMKLPDPFILSASPLTDDYALVKKAYDHGWTGVIFKTAFDGIDIHVPSEYMTRFDKGTYGNCDNVSSRPLAEVCKDVKRLREEYPDKFTMASTGGPLTGNDDEDKLGWQSNARKLEEAGAMAVEFSLSCPQGGDGSNGSIASQSPVMTAKIVSWIMETSDPNIPKIFKLTGGVTSVKVIIRVVKDVLAQYPDKKAGVTLANSFPAVTFKETSRTTHTPHDPSKFMDGCTVGIHGGGILSLTLNTLTQAHGEGVTISANGGAMDYKSSAYMLALGANSVQYCTLPECEGLDIVHDLREGLAWFMEARGLDTIADIQKNPEKVFSS